MAKYKIEIRETLSKYVVVEAEDEADARKIAINNYKSGKDDYVLTADNHIYTEMYMEGASWPFYGL